MSGSPDAPQNVSLDLGPDGVTRGGHLLLERALTCGPVWVVGEPDGVWAWCRAEGHPVRAESGGLWVSPGRFGMLSQPAGRSAAPEPRAEARWGLAARGASVEIGSPMFQFPLSEKDEVWADEAARLYAQAAASQWDPATAIPWGCPINHPDAVEDAVVQVMTYLIENETAALYVPVRFLGKIHPHFREVVQLLAIQAADEARHIEVFTRRALLRRDQPALSSAGGQASLQTLLDEPDFALATFLLSVLGEGSFFTLLRFLVVHAPDAATRELCRLAAQDEARHVAFGVAHVRRRLQQDPNERGRFVLAVERRHGALAETAGLNRRVFDALILLAAGSFERDALARGHDAVVGLTVEMDQGRRARLETLGFTPGDAARLSSLHTRNFM